jgi:uncharacterized membrane protein YphA (DoxX/SURF4 family)
MVWLLVLGAIGTAIYLYVRAQRWAAALGVFLVGVSIAIAFYVSPQAWLAWTVLWFAGVALIVWGTARDTLRHDAWPLLLLRVFIGWAWVDNAQDHFRSGWLPGGAPYLQQATGAVNRPPTYFLDPLYQGFLRGTVAPNLDTFAALTICGELAFGALLAVGLLTPVAAAGLLWQSLNYVEMKSFVSHGAYTDKVFFAADLFCLITLAGLSYGLDASLRHVAPAFVRSLMGVPADDGAAAMPEPQPRPA